MNKTYLLKVLIFLYSIYIFVYIISDFAFGLHSRDKSLFRDIVSMKGYFSGMEKYERLGFPVLNQPKNGELYLPDSLLYYFSILPVVELEGIKPSCNLIYNPEGVNDKSWIVRFKSREITARLYGNWVLYYDGSIKRSKEDETNPDVLANCKYYYITE